MTAMETNTVELFPEISATESIFSTPGDSQEEMKSRIEDLFEMGALIHRYWMLTVIIFGIPGSILSFIIMMNRKNRQLSICIYMAHLSVTDNILLFIAGFAWLVLEGRSLTYSTSNHLYMVMQILHIMYYQISWINLNLSKLASDQDKIQGLVCNFLYF